MLLRRSLAFALLSALVSAAMSVEVPTRPAPASPALSLPKQDPALVLDAYEKDYTAKPGEEHCSFTFTVTNAGTDELVIRTVRTSCGCSVARLPAHPWRLAPGASGQFEIAVDLRGKQGELFKDAILQSNRGYRQIQFHIAIPPVDPRDAMRQRNVLIAQGDRQAVFKGDCATCHAEPARGLMGRDLFIKACVICHADEGRATMVPDLRALSPQPTAELWRQAITIGKPGTLMPAFALAEGGPLTRPQIDSLVDYLTTRFTAEAAAATPTGLKD